MRAAESSDPIRILLVDDHPLMRAGIRALLAAESDILIVDEASDGPDAVRRAQHASFNLAIVDVSLPSLDGAVPSLDGAGATRQILQRLPDMRILALSAHEELSFVRLMLDSGAAGYLLKRSSADELVRAIRVVSGGGTYLDPLLAADLVPAPLRRPRSHRPPVTSLSEREAEVIRLIARGHTAKEMAATLQLSPRTLETYKARAMSKLNLRSRADLIRYALRCGWLREN